MKRAGQVVIFEFPQTNFESRKSRPALLVAQLPGDYDDWLISMISSQTHQYIQGLDEIIRPDNTDFIKSGLKVESVIRVARIAVVAGDILLGTIGEISTERLTRIRNNLSQWIRTGKVADSLPDEDAADNETSVPTGESESETLPKRENGNGES
jgi:mRNA interferase MazF